MSFFFFPKNGISGDNKTAHLVQVLATNPDNLSPIPKIHMVKGKNRVPQAVL